MADKINILSILIIAFFVFSCTKEVKSEGLEIRVVAENLDTPWEIIWGPDDHIWMTERYGRVSRLNPETGEVQELLIIDYVYEQSEAGLLGMVLYPDFDNNPHVFITYNFLQGNEIQQKLVRYTYDGENLINPLEILSNIGGNTTHDGARLWIDEDLKLYMTMGDARRKDEFPPQEIDNLHGKLLRFNLDGSIPDDNPFPNNPVWSYGHRNAQGLVFANGIIYSSEHGTNQDDELNIIEKGRNYGWPLVEGYCDTEEEIEFCEANNVAEPIAAWTPTLAVCGLDYYDHDLIAEWNNSLLMVVLKSARLVQMKLDEEGKNIIDEKHFFVNEYGRLRDICISPKGKVYIATSNRDGRGNPAEADDRILEISPSSSSNSLDKGSADVEVYPIPAKDKLIIRSDEYFSSISFMDMLGNTIVEYSNVNQNYFELNVSPNFAAGTYFAILSTGDGTITKRIIIE